jgi:hypothetical protein
MTSGCLIYMNNIFYVNAPDRDGLFILDLDCNDSHVNSVDAKRCKHDDDKYHVHMALSFGSYWRKTHEGTP